MSSKLIPKSCVLWELGLCRGQHRHAVPGAFFRYGDCITTLMRLWKEVTIVSPTGLCLSLFLPIGLEVSLCQQRRKALTVEGTASLCSNGFEAAWWEGWRFMVHVCLVEQAQRMSWSLQVHLLWHP